MGYLVDASNVSVSNPGEEDTDANLGQIGQMANQKSRTRKRQDQNASLKRIDLFPLVIIGWRTENFEGCEGDSVEVMR